MTSDLSHDGDPLGHQFLSRTSRSMHNPSSAHLNERQSSAAALTGPRPSRPVNKNVMFDY
jgi:hypothetical protein